MQHPDEGTIHSWLDNALSAEEAVGVESHVAECAQCAAAVAEARGFIAASSRILTALDDVPRGVVPGTPAVPAQKRDLRVLWRAAAAVLVVAGGSLIVMRDGSQELRSPVSMSDSVVTTARPAQAGSVDRDLSKESTPRRMSASNGKAGGPVAGTDAAAPTAPPPPASASPEPMIDLSANTAVAETDIAPLKELNVERMLGSRRIVYQISPTDTVTLTEVEPVSLQSVVTTGAASAQDGREKKAVRARAVAPTRTEAAAAAQPLIAGAAPSAAPNTVRWVESATGKTLILSGKLPVERLQEIRQRIETERAAARTRSP